MDFPTFINKWIIGFKPIKYTIFWYWFRLINHSNWRMDDHQRYADFWLNVNHGWDHMNHVWKFEEYWGKGSYPPETMYVSQEAYDKMVDLIENPSPPSPELIKLLNRKAPWEQ